jgi:hypothetical protein
MWLVRPDSRDGIAQLTADQYRGLLEQAGAETRKARERIEQGGVVEDGNRSDALFRHAVDLIRWGHPPTDVAVFLDEWQREDVGAGQTRFRNPHPFREVQRQVEGALAWQQTGGAKTLAEFAVVDTDALKPVVVEGEGGVVSLGGLTLTPTTQVRMRATPWLIKPLLPAECLVLVAGQGGLGKSSYSLARAAK